MHKLEKKQDENMVVKLKLDKYKATVSLDKDRDVVKEDKLNEDKDMELKDSENSIMECEVIVFQDKEDDKDVEEDVDDQDHWFAASDKGTSAITKKKYLTQLARILRENAVTSSTQ